MIQIHQDLLQDKSAGVRRAVAACYRRFVSENYFWHSDPKRAVFHFWRMLATDPKVCDLPTLKVYAKSLLGILPHVKS